MKLTKEEKKVAKEINKITKAIDELENEIPAIEKVVKMLENDVSKTRFLGVMEDGVNIVPYKVKSVRRVNHPIGIIQHGYYKLQAKKPVFPKVKGGGQTKYHHLGKGSSKEYVDAVCKIARRQYIKALEKEVLILKSSLEKMKAYLEILKSQLAEFTCPLPLSTPHPI